MSILILIFPFPFSRESQSHGQLAPLAGWLRMRMRISHYMLLLKLSIIHSLSLLYWTPTSQGYTSMVGCDGYRPGDGIMHTRTHFSPGVDEALAGMVFGGVPIDSPDLKEYAEGCNRMRHPRHDEKYCR